ncbi:hypothetical protein EON66_01645 [archaeon]|nr:MAG: hypothetical protein EON66_01645 [archaeon]
MYLSARTTRPQVGSSLALLFSHYCTACALVQVPPIINFMARHPAVDKFDLSSLRVVFSGAAPLDAVTQSALQDRLKQVSARQGYGMTEMSPVSHIPLASDVVPGSVGRTVANCESMIRNVVRVRLLSHGCTCACQSCGCMCARADNVACRTTTAACRRVPTTLVSCACVVPM